MFFNGKMLFDGDGIPMDVSRAIDYILITAEKGEVDAILYIGIILSEGINVALNIKEFIHYLKMEADKGEVKSMSKLGQIFKMEMKFLLTWNNPFIFFKKGAKKGDVKSILNLGYIFQICSEMIANNDDISIIEEEESQLIVEKTILYKFNCFLALLKAQFLINTIFSFLIKIIIRNISLLLINF